MLLVTNSVRYLGWSSKFQLQKQWGAFGGFWHVDPQYKRKCTIDSAAFTKCITRISSLSTEQLEGLHVSDCPKQQASSPPIHCGSNSIVATAPTTVTDLWDMKGLLVKVEQTWSKLTMLSQRKPSRMRFQLPCNLKFDMQVNACSTPYMETGVYPEFFVSNVLQD